MDAGAALGENSSYAAGSAFGNAQFHDSRVGSGAGTAIGMAASISTTPENSLYTVPSLATAEGDVLSWTLPDPGVDP